MSIARNEWIFLKHFRKEVDRCNYRNVNKNYLPTSQVIVELILSDLYFNERIVE